ncbi:hypothetical protein [Micromonospora psammae]|uniref:hypothetical protein n=1 Tax=Micromonospora sp. CPCC 205556 TaxID=3122398 RepID=UPI002FF1A289
MTSLRKVTRLLIHPLIALAVVFSASVFLPTPAQAATLPGVNIQPPFSGWWDRYGVAGASYHHRPYGGDWAVDMYRAPGETVSTRAWPVSQQGAVSYRIADVRLACRSGVYADGGYVVTVEFHYGGHYVGWAKYAHLANVQVGAGQWVSHGAVLGYTDRFRYSSCYNVSNNDGVHVHFEAYSNSNYACYINRPAGAWVDYWGVIGRIGSGYAYGFGKPCP